MKISRWQKVLLAVLAVLVAALGGTGWYVHQGLRRASKFADFGLCPEARAELQLYLRFFPRDDRAHLLFAEMLVKDPQLAMEESTSLAFEHLAQVADTAKLGATARLQEGRIEFLLLNHPTRSEQRLRRALEIDPSLTDAYRVLWKLYDQTGRSHLAEPFFRAVYEADPWPYNVYALRDWYMSQFFSASSNPTLDRLMGFTSARDASPTRTEAERFIRFRNAEPAAPLGYSALARWFQIEGDPQFALKTLDDGLDKMEGEERDSFFFHTLIGILLQLGDIDRAGEVADAWPKPHEGYEYWLSRASVEEARRNDEEALASMDQALAIWPGVIDWRTRKRRATILAKLGRDEEEAAELSRIKEIEDLMRDEVHQSLRQALGKLDDRANVSAIEDFYRKLHRDYEADGWRDHLTKLASGRSLAPSPSKGMP